MCHHEDVTIEVEGFGQQLKLETLADRKLILDFTSETNLLEQ